MTTPITKLLKNLAALEEAQKNGEIACHVTKVILIATGALCPVHTSHMAMLEHTKQYLESMGNFAVVAGYLSPSHDKYTKGKLKHDNIEAKHRVEMVRLATEDSDWLDVDPFESMGIDKCMSFVNVTHRLKDYIHSQVSSDIRICFCCGADLVVRAPNSFRKFDEKYVYVSIISRPTFNTQMNEIIQTRLGKRQKMTYCVQNVDVDLSSTKVRDLLMNGQSLNTLVPTKVEHYLYNCMNDRYKLK
jgi:nicotinamide mononucleotide adenylyltransferase